MNAPRPSFSVVSFALVVLAVFGLVINALKDRLPPGKPNRLQFEKTSFLVQASHSELDWRPFDRDALAEARRTGKPMLILIGIPYGKAARDCDEFVFSDREVLSFLNRYMVCVRVDGLANPRWIGAFLPLRRATLPMLTGFQLWFLTPEGELYDNAGEIGTTQPLAAPNLVQALLGAREKLREIREGGPFAPVPGADQEADIAALTEPSMPTEVAYGPFESAIRQFGVPELGGFPRYGRVTVMPHVLQYLLLTGRDDRFREMADGLLASPLVDWLDGGFYRSSTTSFPFVVEFDKATMVNAELMSVFAQASIVLKRPLYARIARQTFDWVAGEMVRNGILAGCRVGDEQDRNRSVQQSFSPRRLREVLNGREREIARERLGLRVEDNPIMSVWIREPEETLDDAEAKRILAKLRESRTGTFQYAGTRQLDIHGYVVARLLETARTLGDAKRLAIADDLYSRLDWFRAGDDVKHTIEPGVADQPYLGDYLAYADASLQHFLAFGEADDLSRGLGVLRRARFLFATETVGIWKMGLGSDEPLEPKDTNVAEVLDFIRESCESQAIRLCHAYGRLLRGPSGTDADLGDAAQTLSQAAASGVGQLSSRSAGFGLMGASYFCASLSVADEAYAVAVGPHRVEMANALRRRVPTRLVAPAEGLVRRDLQKRPAGLYLVRGSQIEGPLTVDAAAGRLSSVFRPR